VDIELRTRLVALFSETDRAHKLAYSATRGRRVAFGSSAQVADRLCFSHNAPGLLVFDPVPLIEANRQAGKSGVPERPFSLQPGLDS